MKRPFSPLVWLCAAGGVALSALTICDPNGVYAGYTAALGRDTPAIAAVFTAAQDGVYPWSVFDSPEDIPYSPAYRPLTGTVTDAEMRSSVGNDEPFPEMAPGKNAPVEVTPSVEIIMSEETGGERQTAQQPSADFVTVDQSWFNDALFIGDSHTEGLCDYGGLSNATYYYKRGLDVWSVMKKPFVGGQTIPQALSQRQFGKIYLMLGINEIGCGTTESYAAQYADVVSQLRELQPDALIYIQAIFHTSQKKSDSSVYNNATINARNEAISRIADGEHVFFVDCNAVFDDENGALTPKYSGDGVHVKAPYYTMWRDYLLRFGRDGVAVTPAPVQDVSSQPAVISVPAPAAKPSEPAAPEDGAPPENESAEQPAVEAAIPSEAQPESEVEIAGTEEPSPEPDAAPAAEQPSDEQPADSAPEQESPSEGGSVSADAAAEEGFESVG